MSDVGPKDLQRWSEEVARDPGSPAFVPLAEAYRKQGRRDAAVRVCLRGLERNPDHVDAHGLLARLYLDAGERARAADEWGIVLRLDPESFEANRGLGFYRLERGELEAARGHLERAAETRPGDPTVREALAVLDRRMGAGRVDGARPATDAGGRDVERGGVGGGVEEVAGGEAEAAGEEGEARAATRGAAAPPSAGGARDPTGVFAELREESPFRGAVLVDRDGLALAGALGDGGGAEAIGALFAEALEEAVRAADVLGLGEWRGLSLDADAARLHIGRLGDGYAVVLAAAPDAPAGWVVRAAERAHSLAKAFLEGDS